MAPVAEALLPSWARVARRAAVPATSDHGALRTSHHGSVQADPEFAVDRREPRPVGIPQRRHEGRRQRKGTSCWVRH
ncbi:hypothetical protein MTO96_017692 [Rhipicephalus appendiculatus]